MTAIADSSPAVAPSIIAGLLLAARDHQLQLGLPASSVTQIVEKTDAVRSCAYEAKARLLETLSSLVRPVGRPPARAAAPPPPAASALCREALRFVMEHPGCVSGGPQRRHYSDAFRLFVLDLHQRHPGLGAEELAQAIEVPPETLRDWLRTSAPPAPETDPSAWATSNLHLQTLLAEWDAWEGGFVPFCEHVHKHLRVPYKRSAIAFILEAHGVRLRKRREGRSPDEKGLRKAFETFFPGAQWVADGTNVLVTLFDETFSFNLELAVDAHTDAFAGASIRDEEDSAALLDAVADGKATTGSTPLAVLVDNRPSNLTPEVGETLAADGTLRIPATQGRAQNKAHVEGGFGLFRQMAPPLVIRADTVREAAREVLRLVVTTWARTLNHRPRADRDGRSRVALYDEKPTPEEVTKARVALEERLRRQEAARRTLQARQDPLVRATITAAFARLGIADPDDHLLDAIARYPLSSVVDGIALFEGKRAAGTLPRNLQQPGRYLEGIVRNIDQRREADHICEAMLRARLKARDALLAPLVEGRRAAEKEHAGDAPGLLACLIDHALQTERRVDRLFWLGAGGEVIASAPASERDRLFRLGTRRIHAHIKQPYAERQSAACFLATKAIPLE